MRKVKLIRPWKGQPAGTEIEVSNNEAHALIESGTASLFLFRDKSKNTMLTDKKAKVRMK